MSFRLLDHNINTVKFQHVLQTDIYFKTFNVFKIYKNSFVMLFVRAVNFLY